MPAGDPLQGKRLSSNWSHYCHAIKRESFPADGDNEKGVGPELSQMAGMHPVEFFAESIVNPNAVLDAEDKGKGFLGADGNSKMPTYSDVLTVKQVADLAMHLKSIKN